MAIPAPLTDQEIADQLTRDGSWWYGDNGDMTIEYSFSASLGYWWGNNSEYQLDATQQQWIETALAQLEDMFGFDFVEVTQPANTSGNAPTDIIQFVNDDNTGTYSSSYSYTSGPNTGGIVFNAIVFDDTWNSNQSANLDYGSYGFMTMLHEILHSLGLDHPGDYNAGSGNGPITYAGSAEFEQDTHRYTVMSYFDSYEDASGSIFYDVQTSEFVYPRTPMVYDILAMTSGSFNGNFNGYAGNSTTRNTDTTYGHNATSGIDAAYDFDAHGAPVLTIYDTGGIDTLDLSGDTVTTEAYMNYDANDVPTFFSTRARTETLIDLREGQYSSSHGMTYNIGIAFGTVIENAIGTQFHDTMHGNSADNRLDGGTAGNDTMYGYGGNDTFVGGLGVDVMDGGDDIDTIDLSGATNAQTINLVTNVNTGGFANNDTYLNVENVIGSNTRGDDITGSAGANTLSGMGADDILRGFNGDDVLEGGENNDYLYGGRGADVIDGGNGTDWAMYNDADHGVIVDLGGVGSGGIYADGDTYISIERLRGSDFADTITMDDGVNKVLAGDGNDTIFGLGGKDQLRGGNDNDRINGGADNDTMFGDAGSDVFEFDLGSGSDFIADFENDIDSIELDDQLDGGALAGMTGQQVVDTYAIQVSTTRIYLDFGNGDVLKIISDSGAITFADLYDDLSVA